MLYLLPLAGLASAAALLPIPEVKTARDAVFVPAHNTSIDRHALDQLRPTNRPAVLYSEQPQSNVIMSTTFESRYPVVLLENSALITDVTCFEAKSSIKLSFEDTKAYDIAASHWPRSSLVIVTRHPGCNAANERGVYLVNRTSVDSSHLTITFMAGERTWKDVADKMTIDYLQADASAGDMETGVLQVQSKRSSAPSSRRNLASRAAIAPTCKLVRPAGFICGEKGYVRSPSFLRLVFAADQTVCRDVCLANAKCTSFSFGSRICALYNAPIIAQRWQQDSRSDKTFFNRQCFACSTTTTTTTTTRQTTTTKAPTTQKPTPTPTTALTSSKLGPSSSSSRATTVTNPPTTTTVVVSSTTTSRSTITQTIGQSSVRTTIAAGSSATSSTTTSAVASVIPLTSMTYTTSGTSSPMSTTTSVPSSTTKYKFTPVTSLDAEQLVFLSSITSGISYASDGRIIGTLKSPTQSTEIIAPTADPSDRSQQAALESQLQQGGLPSFGQAFTDMANDLETAFGAQTPPDGVGQFDEDTTPIERRAATGSVAAREHMNVLNKRYSFGEFMEDVDTYACNDIVTSISSKIEDACTVLKGAQVIHCFATGCMKGAFDAPPPVEYTFDHTFPITLPGFPSTGFVKITPKSNLACRNCAMKISNLKLKGSVVVDMNSMSFIDAVWDLEHDSVANLDISLTTITADQDSWTYVMGSTDLTSVYAPGVFNLYPKLSYGMGVNWTATTAASYSMSQKITISGAKAHIFPFKRLANSYSGWDSTIDTTEPQFANEASVSMSAFVQSSLELKIDIFGKSQKKLWVTTQASTGLSGSAINMAKLGYAPCGGDTFQVSKFSSYTNNLVVDDGMKYNMAVKQTVPSPSCRSISVLPPSQSQINALAKAPNAAAFCSSFIRYKPATNTITTGSTVTIATSTTTVTGGGTTTITPSAETTTITVTSSVSSSPTSVAQVKRTAMAPEPSSHAVLDARDLPLQPRAIIRTPAILSTWYPSQVTAACSRLATGTTSTILTTTTTVSSGISTSTIQATETAPVPTLTSTATSYVPATTPGLAVDPSWNQPPWSLGSGASLLCLKSAPPASLGPIDRVLFQRAEAIAYTSCRPALTRAPKQPPASVGVRLQPAAGQTAVVSAGVGGLGVGWNYAFGVQMGVRGTAGDTCTFRARLDDDVLASFQPGVNWQGAVDSEYPAVGSGAFDVQPTREGQTLYIEYSCQFDGGDLVIRGPSFYGPTVGQ